MARRLAFFFDKQSKSNAPLLATDYIRDDQDLSDSDGEEVNDEDPEDAEGDRDADSLSRTL
jgi:hypothetical protein